MENKILVIDPNSNNINSSGGIVTPEQLTINVELKAIKKDRGAISISNGKATVKLGSNATPISFLGGSNVGNADGKPSLTTHYTELGSNFNSNNKDLETLGIKDIQIEFNSACAPLVVINFVDVRGKLFEMGKDSPYSVFWELPYPIFELTVKGYYGKAVTYKLHLTKFNGGFDYSSGNFEIQCNFIGYTYAFLSDIIMGHLKGIPYTVRGLAKIEEKKNANQGVHQFFTFHELNQIADNANVNILKIKNDNKGLKAIKKADEIIESLENFKDNLLTNLKTVGSHRRINDDTVIGFYAYKPSEVKTFSDNYTNNNSEFDTDVETYNKVLSEKLKELNSDTGLDNGYKLTENYYLINNGRTLHTEINKVDFKGNVTNYVQNVGGQSRYIESLADELKYDAFKKGVVALKSSNTLDEFNFTVIDVNDGLKEIDTFIERITLEKRTKLLNLSSEFAESDIFTLGDKYFNPSIGNIINLICDHVDIFMDCVRDVAVEAEKDVKIREADLKNLGGILDEVDGQLGNLKAFPTYSEMEDGVYVDKWIGNVAPNIPEVLFIEDLLEGIIKANQEDIKTIEGLGVNNLGKPQWFPVNVFDSPIFGVTNPYEKLSNDASVEDFLRLVMLRTMIYFYSNKNSTNEDIINMAKMEANNVYSNLSNVDIKNALRVYANSGKSTLISDSSAGVKFKNFTSENNYGQSQSGIVKSSIITNKNGSFSTGGNQWNPPRTVVINDYIYNYAPIISGNNLNYNTVFLPLNVDNYKDYNSNFLIKDGTSLLTNSDRIQLRDSGVIFFSNNDIGSNDDGATTIKILNDIDSVQNKVFFPSYGDGVINTEIKSVNLDGEIVDAGPLNYFFKGTGDGYGELPMSYFFYDKKEDFVGTNQKEDIDDTRYTNLYLDTGLIPRMVPNQNSNTIINKLMSFNKPNSLRSAFNFGSDKYFIPYLGFKSAYYVDSYYSLFGSELYYAQNNIKAKAYLFLHSIPFTNLADGKLLSMDNIGKLFKNKGGFVEVPYSWALFIGALLARRDNKFSVLFGDNSMSFIRELKKGYYPTTSEFSIADTGSGWFNFDSDGYESIDSEILSLSKSARNEFINLFENWATNEYPSLANDMEIFKAGVTRSQIRNFWVNYNISLDSGLSTALSNPILNNKLRNNYSLFLRISDGYENNTPLTVVINDSVNNDKGSPFNFLLELRRGSDASKKLMAFLGKTRVIANASHRVWTNGLDKYSLNRPIAADVVKVGTYLDSFFSEYIKLTKNFEFTDKIEEKSIKEKIFQTINNDDIKLNLYIKIKSIYDKWICGSDEKYADIDGELYSSFRFIDRAYKNIEDDFKVNIIPMVSQLTENYNQSFYNYIARVLGDNNFDFFPLPSFINYNDENEVKNLFKAYTYNSAPTSIKPQFVCMYIGEKSNALGESVNFKNNSFNFNDNSIPADFQSGEETIPVFLVQYGAGDQSIFKDLKLNQNEFTATDESLTITDAISKQTNTSTSMGQNLFDVYINRSYTANVEMLGDAMIQPLMFFQLDNVPMFRGAYTIIKVTHSIKPNTMTTNFTGVRMRFNKTKMIDEAILVKNIFGDISDVSSEGGNLNDLRTSGNIPNTISVDNLKGKINQTEFDKNKNSKFDKYE